MKTCAALLSFGLLLGAATPAFAAATPEGAQRLTSLLQGYLGTAPGVVSVTPQGDGYATRIDFVPLFSKLNDPAVSISLSPFEWMITEQGGGKWKLDQSQPVSFSFGVRGKSDTAGTIASLTSTAVFDEALGALSSSAAEMKDIRTTQKVTEKGQEANVTFALDTMTMASTLQGPSDGASGTTRQAYTGFRETISVPAAADGSAPAMDITLASPSGSQDAAIAGLRLGAFTSLVSWVIAHPSKEAMAPDQAAFKDRMRAALPLFDSLTGTSVMNELTIGSMLGQFAVKQLTFATEVSGASANGRLRQSFAISGLAVPGQLLPPWASGLVPEAFNVDVTVADFNLAAPAALLIDKLDLAKPDPLPEEIDAALLQALLPKGAVAVTLGPSRVLARTFDVTAAGSMTAGPVIPPSGQATVTMKGLDEAMAALQSGPPDIQQIGPLLLLIKGLGKQEPDGALSWNIESTQAGALMVNGADLSKMMGGQQ